MALLIKLKSATLVEALVATILIVIIFIVASLVLNNLLLNSFSRNTHAIENRIAELAYNAGYGNIRLPYHEDFKEWTVDIKKEQAYGKTWLNSRAVNITNGKEIVKNSICEPQK